MLSKLYTFSSLFLPVLCFGYSSSIASVKRVLLHLNCQFFKGRLCMSLPTHLFNTSYQTDLLYHIKWKKKHEKRLDCQKNKPAPIFPRTPKFLFLFIYLFLERSDSFMNYMHFYVLGCSQIT